VTTIIASLAELADRYDAAFVDLWGCVHDGVRAHEAAVEALRAFRAGGGRVVLVTNAPRPRASVAAQIARLGVPDDAWDAIATSGDAARVALFEGAVGARVWFMGQDADLAFFEPPRVVERPVAVERVPLAEAEGHRLLRALRPAGRTRGEPRGLREGGRPRPAAPLRQPRHRRGPRPRAGVVRGSARRALRVHGRPGALLRQAAPAHLRPRPPAPGRSGPPAPRRPHPRGGRRDRHGRAGAAGAGLDCLFVTGGLAARETGTVEQPEPLLLDAYLAGQKQAPAFSIGYLR
jgi:hypothetical protein